MTETSDCFLHGHFEGDFCPVCRGGELVPTSADIVIPNPATGEALSLDASAADLAAAIDAVKALESELREFKGVLGKELVRRMDREATWTLRAGGLKVTAPSPGGTEYDVDRLHAELLALIEAGRISRDAAGKALKLKTEKVVRKAGVNALLKLGDEIAEAIRRAEVPKAGNRNVTVSRDG